MFEEHPQRRPENCISELAFDQYFAEELSESELKTVELHLEDCHRCQQQMRHLKAEAATFLAAAPSLECLKEAASTQGHGAPSQGSASGPRRPTVLQRYGAQSGLFLAAAAALALLVVRPGGQPEGAEGAGSAEGVRSKGGSRLGFHVKRGQQVHAGQSGERVYPGDRLRFSVKSRRAAYVGVFSRDSEGAVSVYYPAGSRQTRVEAGRETALPASVELDDTLGSEQLAAVFCPEAATVQEIRAALESELKAPRDCVMDVLPIFKVARP